MLTVPRRHFSYGLFLLIYSVSDEVSVCSVALRLKTFFLSLFDAMGGTCVYTLSWGFQFCFYTRYNLHSRLILQSQGDTNIVTDRGPHLHLTTTLTHKNTLKPVSYLILLQLILAFNVFIIIYVIFCAAVSNTEST